MQKPLHNFDGLTLEWIKTLARDLARMSDPKSEFYNPLNVPSATDTLIYTILDEAPPVPDESGLINLTGNVYITLEEYEKMQGTNRKTWETTQQSSLSNGFDMKTPFT